MALGVCDNALKLPVNIDNRESEKKPHNNTQQYTRPRRGTERGCICVLLFLHHAVRGLSGGGWCALTGGDPETDSLPGLDPSYHTPLLVHTPAGRMGTTPTLMNTEMKYGLLWWISIEGS